MAPKAKVSALWLLVACVFGFGFWATGAAKLKDDCGLGLGFVLPLLFSVLLIFMFLRENSGAGLSVHKDKGQRRWACLLFPDLPACIVHAWTNNALFSERHSTDLFLPSAPACSGSLQQSST